jgi:hypothetical protein
VSRPVTVDSPWWRESGADSADLGTGETDPVGVCAARGGQPAGEVIRAIADVAGALRFATVATGLALSLAGLHAERNASAASGKIEAGPREKLPTSVKAKSHVLSPPDWDRASLQR